MDNAPVTAAATARPSSAAAVASAVPPTAVTVPDRPADRRAQLEQLLAACEAGDAARVTRLLSAEGAPEVDTAAEDGTTPLQVASASGCEETVRALLMRGAALDSANHLGWTPLLHACRHGHTGVATLLLQRGASPRARTRLGVDALVLAVRGGHTQTARLLLDAGAASGGGGVAGSGGAGAAGAGSDGPACELSALAVAALTGHDPLLRLLTDRGWDAGERAPATGTTPLMCSAMNGHTVTAQALVERGCDPNVEDINGKTALQLAVDQGKKEVRSFLDRKTTNKSRMGIEVPKLDIIEATKKGDIVRIREILDENDNQADFSSPQDGVTPLMYAAMSGRIDMAILLVEHGCDVNKQDSVNEWTALMHAVYYGKRSMVKYLVSVGADVSLQEKRGMTAFDMATFRDDVDKDLVRLLVVKNERSNSLPPKKDLLKPDKASIKSVGVDGSSAHNGTANGEHHDRTQGLKALWSRVSNGFKNFKLNTARTLNLPTHRLSTLADAVNTSPSKNRVLKSKAGTSKLGSRDDSSTTFERASLSTFAAPSLRDAKKKSMSMYALVNNPVVDAVAELEAKGRKSKTAADVGPFMPLPNFDTISGYMPSPTAKKSKQVSSTIDLAAASPRHPMSKSSSPRRNVFSPDDDGGLSTAGGAASGIPIIVESVPVCSSPSPDSSGGASSISTIFSAPGNSGSGGRASSATSSTLTPGGGGHHLHNYDRFPKRASGNMGDVPRPLSLNFLLNQPARKSSLNHLSVTPSQAGYNWPSSATTGSILSAALQTSPGSSTSARPAGSSSAVDAAQLQQPVVSAATSRTVSSPLLPAAHMQHSLGQSGSLSVAENAQPARFNGTATSASDEADESDPFVALLKKFSLEHYKEIFDQQEIDIEAFLALSDSDLYELGITDAETQRQILAAASELRLSTSGSLR